MEVKYCLVDQDFKKMSDCCVLRRLIHVVFTLGWVLTPEYLNQYYRWYQLQEDSEPVFDRKGRKTAEVVDLELIKEDFDAGSCAYGRLC
jgi:hypothetical protein